MASKSDLPSFDEYFAPAVKVLKGYGGSATIEEFEEGVAAEMKLSDEVRSVLHGEGPRTQFDYELAWVRTYLKKVGAAENSDRGVWRLTPSGHAMSNAELALVPQKVRAEDREKRLKKSELDNTDPGDLEKIPTGDDSDESGAEWKEVLLECLLKIEPSAFERLCQRILRESGFVKVEVTGKSGDGGIDGIGVLRLLGQREAQLIDAPGFGEQPIPFERPIVEMTVSRLFRDRSFMFNVRAAYSNRCAMTGLRLINGGGRPEVQAAHIQPVASKGPDSVRNGLALSGTVHWMFDRGLISIGDDYKILTAKDHLPADALRLLNQSGLIHLPDDQALYPNAHYLKFHRDNVFKG
jgi:Mrr N-terminal domain/Restriction endonuclease/HNH endonuclease